MTTGRCPDPEELQQYREGSLPESRARFVEAHLDECGVCSLLLQRLDAFDEAAAAPAARPHPAEAALSRRIAPLLTPARRPWWQSPALGYVLALLLAYPAWRGLRPPQPASLAESPVPVDLNASRAAMTAAVLVPSGARSVALSFQVSFQSGDQWTATVTGGKGGIIVPRTSIFPDARGNTLLIVRDNPFPPGAYTLSASSASGGLVHFGFQSR